MLGDTSSAAEMGLLEESPWQSKKKHGNKKRKSDEENETEESRAEKRRLRVMVNEKKNRAKRAAVVDRVLRGSMTKKKKMESNEKSMAEVVKDRLKENKIRSDCARIVSKGDQVVISFTDVDKVPPILREKCVAKYPPRYERDPRTGKRILATA